MLFHYPGAFVRGFARLICAVSVCLPLLGPGSLPAAAQPATGEPSVLTVHTYRSFAGKYGPGPAIKQGFEATCKCRVEWVLSDDAGALLARLKLEGAASKADVVIGLDTNFIAEAKASGLFAPHGAPPGNLDLPLPWQDETFLPYDWSWFAFIHDSTRVKAPPTSFEDLAGRDDIRIIVQDPRTSTPGLGLLLWLKAAYGDKAGDLWQRLAPRIVTVTKGWSEAYGLFLKGEADMVLSYTTSPAYHIAMEQKSQYKAAIFTEGHYLQVEVAARLRNSSQPELAGRFLAYLLSDEAQAVIPGTNWMYPARLPQSGLPASFTGLDKPGKSLLMTPEEVMKNRRAWIDEWLVSLRR